MKGLSHIIFAILLVSCAERPRYVSRELNNGKEVITVESDDIQMSIATAKARESYDSFIEKFLSADSSETLFSVKLRFAYGDQNGEHMWVNHLHFKGKKLMGILNNDPIHTTLMKAGDTLEVDRDLVSDWMYLRNGEMVGGYTTRVLYGKMTSVEKKDFTERTGLIIK